MVGDPGGIRDVFWLVRGDVQQEAVQQEAERMTLTNPINGAETCAHSVVFHKFSRNQNSPLFLLHCFAKL